MNQETKQKISRQLSEFCDKHLLPDSYADMAGRYFLPLANELAVRAKSQSTTLLVGINGCQGSGKSTLAELLAIFLKRNHHLTVANLSIDDFYHTRAKRWQLAREVHPLFATRGVPGTHDIDLLQVTLERLSRQTGLTHIPRFDKTHDDQCPPLQWDSILAPVDVILLEGWCIGVSPQENSELSTPVNELESREDREQIWRSVFNEAIAQEYQPLFKKIDILIILQAPDFDCVYQWRKIQEDKLRLSTDKNSHAVDKKNSEIMNEQQLKRFIQHYQRLTEHMLRTLPLTANVVFTLNRDHRVTGRINNEHTNDQ